MGSAFFGAACRSRQMWFTGGRQESIATGGTLKKRERCDGTEHASTTLGRVILVRVTTVLTV